jgi:hypothetical protein
MNIIFGCHKRFGDDMFVPATVEKPLNLIGENAVYLEGFRRQLEIGRCTKQYLAVVRPCTWTCPVAYTHTAILKLNP